MKQNLRVRISRLERGASRQSEGVEAAPRWLAGLLKTDTRALERYAQLVGAGQQTENVGLTSSYHRGPAAKFWSTSAASNARS